MTEIPTLATDRLTLRGLRQADFEPLVTFYDDDRSAHVGGPMPREAVWRHLAAEIGHWSLRGYGRFAVEETATGAFVGVVGPWNPEGWPEAEIGWDLMAGFEGRGYATEAGAAARRWAYDTLGWTTAISLVAPGNPASARVAERLGCARDGEFRHTRLGALHIWRHPAPEDLAA